MGANEILLLAWVSVAAGTDLCTDKIPNELISSGSIYALAALVFEKGLAALPDVALGFLFPPVCLFALFAIGGIGGGDLKLLSMIGAFLGWRRVGTCMLLAAVLIALYALCMLLRLHLLGKRLRYFWQYVCCSLLSRKLTLYAVQPDKKVTVHGAVPIMLALWMLMEGLL